MRTYTVLETNVGLKPSRTPAECWSALNIDAIVKKKRKNHELSLNREHANDFNFRKGHEYGVRFAMLTVSTVERCEGISLNEEAGR